MLPPKAERSPAKVAVNRVGIIETPNLVPTVNVG